MDKAFKVTPKAKAKASSKGKAKGRPRARHVNLDDDADFLEKQRVYKETTIMAAGKCDVASGRFFCGRGHSTSCDKGGGVAINGPG